VDFEEGGWCVSWFSVVEKEEGATLGGKRGGVPKQPHQSSEDEQGRTGDEPFLRGGKGGRAKIGAGEGGGKNCVFGKEK